MVECGGLRAASRNARFLLRKVFALVFDKWFTDATTTGGVRRIEFADAKTAALHKPLGADICEEVDQNLGGFWQNLGDSWQIRASENATAFARNNVKKSETFFKKQVLRHKNP